MLTYFIISAIITFVILAVMMISFEQKKANLNFLFIELLMTIANCGYISLAVSSNETEALLANKLCYLGGCFVPMFTLFLVCALCNYKMKKWLKCVLCAYSFFVYGLVLSTGFSSVYYVDIELVEFMGVTAFSFVSGPGRIFFNIILYGYIIAQCGLLIYGLVKKHSVSKKSLWLLVGMEVISIVSFFVVRAISPFFEIMPFLYVVDGFVCLYLYFKGGGYNVEDNLLSAFLKQDKYAYVMVDNRIRYLGCTDIAMRIFPDLKDCIVDKKLNYNGTLQLLEDWIEKYKTRLDENFGYEKQGSHYECKVKRIWHNDKAFGYILEMCEDTDRWKYVQLMESYNVELEGIRLELSKQVENQMSELRQKQETINDLFIQTVTALSEAVDAKDRYTSGHSLRVAQYAKMIAAKLGKTEEEQEEIFRAGLLHDVGKIRISEEIINKPGKLTEEEYNIIKIHTVTGRHILRGIKGNDLMAIAAKYHHERYDGKGYPNGIKGTNIPEVARIIGVADAYDAMSSNRSYRAALPQSVVRWELEKGKGTQFDPVVADVMIGLIDEDVEYTMKQQDCMNRKILVIDDESINHERIVDIMKTEPMYSVYSAFNGKEALQMLENDTYNLIMIDTMMTEMSGLEILQHVRKKVSTPVVVMMNDKTVERLEDYLDCGCDDYITKPLSPLLVKEVIHNMTERIQLNVK